MNEIINLKGSKKVLTALLCLALLSSLLVITPAEAAGTVISTEPVGLGVKSFAIQSDANSFASQMSADGRYVVFQSTAGNLVFDTSPTNNSIFYHDRQTGSTTRISVAPDGAKGNGDSTNPSISADGRYVVFASAATNLVASDNNGRSDIFLYDTQSHTTSRVSKGVGVESDGNSDYPVISSNGQYIVFQSAATNLLGVSDTNSTNDIFRYDINADSTELVSMTPSGSNGNQESKLPRVSSDGRYIAFISNATDLVTGDTNSVRDVFVRDMQGGMTVASLSATGGLTTSSFGADATDISNDGRYVVFHSEANDLVSGDNNNRSDVFLRDIQASTTVRVSKGIGGAESDSYSWYSSISGNGNFVVFSSASTNLVTGDTK